MNDLALPSTLDDDTRALINRLADGLKRKRRRNLLRQTYYNGKRSIGRVSTVVPPQYYRLGLVLGWASKPVDLLNRRCNLDALTWPGGEINELGVRQIWDDNMLAAEIDSAQVSSLIHGVSYLVNVAGEPGEPVSQVHVVDALNGFGEWNPRNRRLEALLSVTDRQDGRVTGFVLYQPGSTYAAVRDGGKWWDDYTETGWGELLAEPLVYKPRVGRPFGHSRITRASMGIADAATRAIIRLEGHLDVYSYPELWMLGADESIFRNDDGSRRSVMDVRLGRIKGIPDDEDAANPRADVKQFSAADPTPHLAGLNAYAKMFARENGLPDSAVAITDVSNPTSAESYDASQYELIAEAEGTTRDWTKPIAKTVQRALAIAQGETSVPAEWQSITPKWRDPRFLSRAAEADAGTKQLSAVPWLAETTVGLELLGLSQAQIDRALAERTRAEGRALAAQIAQAEPLPASQVPGIEGETVATGA